MSLKKRSLTLDRHRTSLSLAALVAEIDRGRVAAGEVDNLSSAVRVWLVERLLEREAC